MSAEKSLSKAIKHYQNSLDKHSENRNDLKLLHYISRLQELPVQVHHLEETGVGRTVNGLRKLGGEVSEAAKSLVAKWKQMVLAQHEQEEEEENQQNNDNDNNETDRMIIDTNEEEEQEENLNHSNYYKIKEDAEEEEEDGDDEDEEIEDNRENDEQIEQKSKEFDDRKSKQESPKPEKSHKSHKHKHKEKDKNNSKHHHHHHHSHNHHKEHSDKGSSSRTKPEKISNHHKHDKDRSESKEKKRHKSSKSDINNSNSSSSGSSKKVEEKSSRKDDRHQHHHRTSNHEKRHSDNKHKSKREDMAKSTNGIDSASGASFAEALGMCEPSSSKSSTKRKLTPDKNNTVVVKEKTIRLAELPPKPSEETPQDLDISSLLPPITPNYRPLGNLTMADISTKKTISEFDDLSTIITSKNQRTKVYSGNKTFYNKVPTLFDLCVRILQDNIDALEYTGGVPYLILKPILEKATPTQLFSLEHHNPYLVEDTDELWQFHCQKNFRNKQPEEFESWREMYMRCLDEREAKLKALTANIKQAQDKSTPIRTTKLAYVDDVVKPPRNILKKQAKNAAILDKTPTITPSARLNSLATAGEAGKIVVPNPGSRAAERSSSNHTTNNKPKKAPLMMKSISLLKNRFRR